MRALALLALLALLTALLPAAVGVDGPAAARGIVGSPFSCRISASGAAPLTYGATGLPAGLSLNPLTGIISGTPTTATTDPILVTISATAAAGSGSGVMALSIDAAPSAGFPANAAAITVTAGSACSFQLRASAVDAVFSAVDLPDGLLIDPDGLIWGVPGSAGISTAALSCDDGTTATSMAITVLEARPGAPAVTMAVQPRASIGAPFGYIVEAPGADAFGCSNLPAWLALDAGTGTVSGTPGATAATANLQITASAGALAASTVIALPVATPAVAGHVPSAPPLIEGTADSGLGWQVSTVLPTAFDAANLPGGLTLDAASGVLTGAPLAGGIHNVVITADPGGTDAPVRTTVGMRIRAAIAGAPIIAPLLPPLLTVGAPAAVAVPLADGSPAATSFSITGSADFAISAAGIASGTPTAAGTASLRIAAGNAAGSAVTTLMLRTRARVAAAPLPTTPPVLRVTAGCDLAAALTADAVVDAWTVAGLPPLVAAAPFTGIVSGAVADPGLSTIAVGAADADGGNATSMVLHAETAASGAPLIAQVGPWHVSAGQPARIALQSDAAAAAWTVVGLPAGLARSGDRIVGTPTAAGIANLALTASVGGRSARTVGLLLVEAAVAGGPVFAAGGDLVAVVDTPFAATLRAGGSPFAFTIAAAPAWLLLDEATGALSGTPDAEGTYVLPVTARNAAGTVRSTVVLRVYATAPPAGGGDADGVGGISGGGCGAGAAGLVLLALAGLVRRPSRRPRATPRR